MAVGTLLGEATQQLPGVLEPERQLSTNHEQQTHLRRGGDATGLGDQAGREEAGPGLDSQVWQGDTTNTWLDNRHGLC